MPYYKGVLDKLVDDGHKRDARNVLSSLLMATWNLRELGADKSRCCFSCRSSPRRTSSIAVGARIWQADACFEKGLRSCTRSDT
jgi:hypothetical protein